MSIKSQEGHMRQLALLLTTDLGCIFGERESGPNGSKKAFLNVGKVFLRALAKDLGLHEVTVSANSGGIAVSGTCSLYGMWEDRGIAVWIEQRLKLSHGELREQLKDKDPTYYYTDILVSNGKTLGDFISRR